MAIVASDIKFALSGGASNTNVNASLGGARATTGGGGTADITSAVKNNLFDDVSGAESAAGDVEYRGFYAHNSHGSLALQAAVVWIDTQTTSADTDFAIGVAAEDVNVTMATIANESTAPAGVTFTAPSSRATGLNLNTASPATGIPSGQARGVWVRRTVNAGAAAASDSGSVSVGGDTAP